MLMHKILQDQLLCAFVANLKIDAIYALYPESFCDKNLAIRKVVAFCDSEEIVVTVVLFQKLQICWDMGIFCDHYKCSNKGSPTLYNDSRNLEWSR